MSKIIQIILILTLTACASAEKGSDQSKFAWQIERKDYDIIETLTDTKTITHYDGSSEQLTLTNSATAGQVYVLVELQVNKASAGGHTFDWKKLNLVDQDGNTYVRLIDQFLADHHYEVLPSISLALGSNQGWIGFEIPKTAAEGKLVLIYQADEGENKVIVQP